MTIRELLSQSQITQQRFDELYGSTRDLLKDALGKYAKKHLRVMEEILCCQQPEDERILAYFQTWIKGDRKVVQHDASLIAILATEIAELDEDIISVYQNMINTIIFRLSVVISDGKKSGAIISMLAPTVFARNIVNIWLGAAIMDGIGRTTIERKSIFKIMRALLYSQFY